MDPYFLRRRLVLEQLHHQRVLRLHRLLERQREQRALDDFFAHSALLRQLDEFRNPVPRLPDGELDMMHSIRRGSKGLDASHHQSTSAQESVPPQESSEQRQPPPPPPPPPQPYQPQLSEADARVVNGLGPRPFSANPMLENLYLAHGDVSNAWPDAHPLGFTDDLDANLFRAHEPPPQRQRWGTAGPGAFNNPAPAPSAGAGMGSNPFQAHEAPNSSGSHLPRLP